MVIGIYVFSFWRLRSQTSIRALPLDPAGGQSPFCPPPKQISGYAPGIDIIDCRSTPSIKTYTNALYEEAKPPTCIKSLLDTNIFAPRHPPNAVWPEA